MCGRFTLTANFEQLVTSFRLLKEPQLPLRYNIAPTQDVAVIRQVETHREFSWMHWGLIPSWAKDPKIGARMINARAETVAEKPSFRAAFKRRRCLIPATGFYEWKKLDEKHKQPYHIGMKHGDLFAFAGLWEHWNSDGAEIESCTIITTEANELIKDIHDRMPVILPEEEYDRWLDPKNQDKDELTAILKPSASDEMKAYTVDRIVNNPRNEIPACIEPVESM